MIVFGGSQYQHPHKGMTDNWQQQKLLVKAGRMLQMLNFMKHVDLIVSCYDCFRFIVQDKHCNAVT